MADCSCLYSSFDGDCAEFATTTRPKARKPHKCFECRRVIEAGETYERHSGKWDGEVGSYAICLQCREIRAALYCDGEYVFGELWDDVEEQIFREHGLTVECIDKLSTPEAKGLLQQRWMAYVERKAKR